MKGLLALALLVSCGSAPQAARPVANEFVEVEYPPPPAQIEETDEALPGRPECIWLHGFYDWRGRRWQWQPGLWLVPPAACSYAPASLVWSRGSAPRLYYTPPRWYPSSATTTSTRNTCAPAIPCLTPSSPTPR